MLFSVALLALMSTVIAAPKPQFPEEVKNTGGGGVAQQTIELELSQEGVMEFQLAHFLQNLEVDFFKQGSEQSKDWPNKNINGVKPADEVKRIWAEQKSYTESIAQTLNHNKQPAVEPCKYKFPFKDEKSFFAMASIVSNIGVGFLINLENRLAKTDPEVIPHISRMIPVKARHDSYFRMYAGEVPNPQAYETTLPLEWAYNLALDLVEPGSCKNPPPFFKNLKVYPDLSIAGSGEATSLTPNSPGALHFSIGQKDLMPPGWDNKKLWIAWANQDNKIQYTPVTKDGDSINADLPEGLFGMAYAVLTDQKDQQAALDLVKYTVAGPVSIPLGPGKYDE